MALTAYPSFIDGSETLLSRRANYERTINWYQEQTSPGLGKNNAWLVPRPGLFPFVVLAAGPVRAVFSQDDRCFAVGGTGFYEVLASQTATFRGTVALDGRPATISSNGHGGNQLFVTSGGHGYIYDLTTDVLTEIADPDFLTPTVMGAFCDGYFLSLKDNSNTWQFSALEDGTSWSALDVNQTSTTTDNIRALVVAHRDVWLFGSQTTQVWADTGVANTPFSPIPGSQLQMGICGSFAWTVLDNAPLWVGENEQGNRMVFRANGYSPQRISDHAEEDLLTSYSQVSDLIGWSYQDRGHAMFLLYESVGDTTSTYDAATGRWHEQAIWDPTFYRWLPHLGRCHTYAFNTHLVGDRLSGAIYIMSQDYKTDGQVTV